MDKGDFEEWLTRPENRLTIEGIGNHLAQRKIELAMLSSGEPNQELLIRIARAQGAQEAVDRLLNDFLEGEFHVS